jgi:hypothetical protein
MASISQRIFYSRLFLAPPFHPFVGNPWMPRIGTSGPGAAPDGEHGADHTMESSRIVTRPPAERGRCTVSPLLPDTADMEWPHKGCPMAQTFRRARGFRAATSADAKRARARTGGRRPEGQSRARRRAGSWGCGCFRSWSPPPYAANVEPGASSPDQDRRTDVGKRGSRTYIRRMGAPEPVTDLTGRRIGTVRLVHIGSRRHAFWEARSLDGCDLGAHTRRVDAEEAIQDDWEAGRPGLRRPAFAIRSP